MHYDVNYIIYKMNFIGDKIFDDIVVLLLNILENITL